MRGPDPLLVRLPRPARRKDAAYVLDILGFDNSLLFNFAPLPDAPFLLMTVLTALGILLSLGLPKMLVTRRPASG